jgi:hypothetical protein
VARPVPGSAGDTSIPGHARGGQDGTGSTGHSGANLACPAGTADADTQKTHRMGPRSAVIHPVPDLIKALEIAITHFSRPGVFANETHVPLVYPGQRHIPYASTSGAAAAHTLTATSASKAEPVRPQMRRRDPHQRARPAALGGYGLLRVTRCEQSRRGRQNRGIPARRGMAGQRPRLPRRQPPPSC